MKKLCEIVDCNYDIEIKGIKTNSNEVCPGDLFVCIQGVNVDRHDYIEDAVANGAVALITSKDVKTIVPYIKVDSPNDELRNICLKYYDNPLEKLKLIGITGTDGKTSTATIVQTLIGNDLCGFMGTTGIRCKAFDKTTSNTTLPFEKLLQTFQQFLNSGCKYVVMEVSSEAIYYGRVKNINYDVAAYTTITSDHLNTHKTLENYISCKKQLFKQIKKNGFCILNEDNQYYSEFLKDSCGIPLSYGKNPNASLVIKRFELYKDKTNVWLDYQGKEYFCVSPLIGEFNVYNLACALLICLSLGFEIEELLKKVRNIYVEGRVNIIKYKKNMIVVDYAHTYDAMKKIIDTFQKIPHKKLYIAFGCTGDRDREKRAPMLELATRNADFVFVTSDDLHYESFEHIVEDMQKGIHAKNYMICKERKLALKKAIEYLNEDDILLVLGKGHERFIVIGDKKIPFNDGDVIRSIINEKVEVM